MINKLCFYIALINYNVFYSKTKGLKFHFWMSQGKTRYQFEENDPRIGRWMDAWRKFPLKIFNCSYTRKFEQKIG